MKRRAAAIDIAYALCLLRLIATGALIATRRPRHALASAFLLVSKSLYAIVTPVLGESIIIGMVAHTLRLRAEEVPRA